MEVSVIQETLYVEKKKKQKNRKQLTLGLFPTWENGLERKMK